MFVSSLRSDDLATTIPARPIVKAVLLGPYLGKCDADAESSMYRITLLEPNTSKPSSARDYNAGSGVKEPRKPLLPLDQNQKVFQDKHSNTDAGVVQLEVFACVQRFNHPEITRWKQIALVDLRKKNGRRDSVEPGRGKGKSSVRIAGFSPGYKYQIVVRAVGAHGKRSLFSQSVSIVPPA